MVTIEIHQQDEYELPKAALYLITLALMFACVYVGWAHGVDTTLKSLPAPETPVIMQCDQDTIIKAHYVEVVDAMLIQGKWFDPAYIAPLRKPEF